MSRTLSREKSSQPAVSPAQPQVLLAVETDKRWCTICKKKIYGKLLVRHMAETHKTGKASDFPCLKCGKIFTRKQALLAHLAKTCRRRVS